MEKRIMEMETLRIEGRYGASELMIGASLDTLADHIPLARTIIITDTRVAGIYAPRFPDCPVIPIGLGERVKTLDTARTLYSRLLGLGADRNTFIIGIGGGIVCDIAGFTASTFMRGVDFGFVPTTLLAQVDASVGGKNGVNFNGYKNIVGVFNQPRIVLCDPTLLSTLPAPEVRCGLAEIVKHAAVASRDYFNDISAAAEAALALDPETLSRLVLASVRIKAAIVAEDEREKGRRRVLNFGHTFGHALERATGIAHGEAVAIGMSMAAALSVERGLLSPPEASELTDLLTRLGLPTAPPVRGRTLKEGLLKDKKRDRDAIHFVLLSALGQTAVEKIPTAELDAFLEKW